MVEVIPGGNARADPADRNPTDIVNSAGINSAAAVRADTDDWTYTVPASRKCYLEYLYARVQNNSTTPLNARAGTYITLTPSGGSGNIILEADLMTGVASVQHVEVLGGTKTLLAGDTIKATTYSSNNAAGTSVQQRSAMAAMEYDA